MSYQTYTTEAIVCGSQDSRSADRSFLLFTRDAGMLWATARSVREERSKQRHALQDFSQIRVSLVKGKTGWRIGSVEALGNTFMESGARDVRIATAHLIKLIRRYIHGESPLAAGYDELTTALMLVTSEPSATHDTIVSLFHIRLLTALGYVAPDRELTAVMSAPTLTEALSLCTPAVLVRVAASAKTASAASHL